MILKETGWTRHYLLWKISWINVQMMIADAPRLKKVKGTDKKTQVSGNEIAARLKQKFA